MVTSIFSASSFPAFCTHLDRALCCSPWILLESAPNAPITTGTTLDFTFHICSSCSLSPWCSFFILWSTGIATSITSALFCSLSSITVSGWLASSCLSVCNLKSRRTLVPLFSTTFDGVSHWDLGTPWDLWCSPYAAVILYM